jgi:ATP-dependent DNA ligase
VAPQQVAPRQGRQQVARACKLGLEGIVSKRKGSRYQSGRSPHWLKSKNPASAAVLREGIEDLNR